MKNLVTEEIICLMDQRRLNKQETQNNKIFDNSVKCLLMETKERNLNQKWLRVAKMNNKTTDLY